MIFDMDGVLVDTEPIYEAMHYRHFEQLGITVTQAQFLQFIGTTSVEMWTRLQGMFQLPHSLEALLGQEEILKKQIFAEQTLAPMPGLLPLLQGLKQRQVPMAVASSSNESHIHHVLQSAGIHHYFQKLVSGQHVANSKPAPDIFLAAAAHFGVAPAQCLVIEDSTNGTLAAKAAGMDCIGFDQDQIGRQDLSAATQVITAFSPESAAHIYQYFL